MKLSFPALGSHPALAAWTLDEAREVVATLEGAFKEVRSGPRSTFPLEAHARVRAGLLLGASADRPTALEQRVREQDEAALGAALVGLPVSMESARWFQALQLSPRYMGEGVRDAAREMFNSPAVLLSVGSSMMLYMLAWAAPEPVFSKALAAAVTVGLLLTYTATELHHVGLACLNLYREAEAARTRDELDAAAEHFGKALGGVGLRVLVTVAGAKLAQGLPQVPGGGLWSRLSPPRSAFAGGGSGGGLSIGAGTRAQVSVANGTVVLMGVVANTTASAASAVRASARTSGNCAESKQDDNQRHHLCTDKNNTSEVTGGPWTPLFEDLFARAGMGLDDPANLVYLRGHKGPHSEAYHREVFSRIRDALGSCRAKADCRALLVKELDQIAGDLCTPGSNLSKLGVRAP
ncbi:AHH domain-containing protein [Cystobacter fuscus]